LPSGYRGWMERHSGTDPVAADSLSHAELEFLRAHSGVPVASAAALRRLDERSAAAATADRDATLTGTAAAACTGLTAEQLDRMVACGELLAHPAAEPGELRFPDWQFTADGTLLPHLAAVLAAMPAGSASVTVRTFMMTPTTDLIDRRELPAAPVSPAQWLATGRDPQSVIALAATLGEQL
jgi:hypothetical protein